MSAERIPQFPNPDLAPRLVLYPLAGGGVALDWSLDPALIQQARIAFAAHQPVAKLCLRRADGDGVRLAEAVFADLSSLSTGCARFEAPVVGPLQAELGFEGQRDGGWLLLARSNRLDAVPEPGGLEPGTAAAGAEQGGASSDALAIAQAPAIPVPREPVSEAPGRSAGPVSTDAPLSDSAADLQSLNRHAMLTSSPSVSAAAGAVPGGQVDVSVALDPGSPISAKGGSGLPRATRFPDLSLAALSDRPELRGSAFPLARAAHATSEVADDLTSPTADGLASVSDSVSDSDSVAEKASEQVLLDQEPPNRQDVAPSETRVARGSGPLAPYPSDEGAMIRGELHVFGSAAPGSLLDLGGHPFRVGPGGRFSFRVALDDADLLASLLARLPRLPVDERDS